MTQEELEKASVEDLLDSLDYCGYDNYYASYREIIIIEIKNRLEENEQLKSQFDKLLDFVVDRIEECDVFELIDACINSEGVCPFAWSDRNIKDLIIKHINRS